MSNFLQINFEKFLQAGAVFSVAGRVVIGVGEPQRSAVPKPPCFYSPDFFLRSKKPWLSFEELHVVKESDWRAYLGTYSEAKEAEISQRDWVLGNFEDYKNQFDAISRAFKEGACEKVVSWTTAHSNKPMGPLERLQVLKSIFKNKQKLDPHINWDGRSYSLGKEFIYGHWGPQGGFLGKTPEILFGVVGNHLKTMALAGTSDLEQKDFLEDPKERQEHLLVVKDIRDKLKNLGDVQQSETSVHELKHLQHLRTDFFVDLYRSKEDRLSFLNPKSYFNIFNKRSRGVDVVNLVRKLHPTAALGVYPVSSSSFQILKKIRSHQPQLDFFGAPFGIQFLDEEAFIAVGIRQVVWDKNQSYIPAGCGVVQESQIEKEWRELKQKINSVMKASDIGILKY